MKLKRVILTLFMLAFFSAIIFDIFGKTTFPLNGDISRPGKPEFKWKTFFKATYQDEYAEYLRNSVSVHSELIRMNNQYRFTFFNIMPDGGTIVGKNGVLFEIGRIKAVYGDGYMGEYSWKYYMDMFDSVSDTMHKLNKPIIYVNVGDKSRIYEEYIPDNLRKTKTDSTNYNLYLRKLKDEKRIYFIDLAGYFLKIKDTCKTELYPPYSVHWSLYSTYLATDSIAKYTNKLLPQYEAALPVLQGFEVTKKEKDIEYDLIHFLNMYYSYAYKENHYPIVKYAKKTTKRKPRVMLIGDSFGQMLADNDYMYNAFSDSSIFIRYNAEYRRKGPKGLINVNTINYWEEFDKSDIVIFVSSEINLDNFGFGFIEKAYDHFKGIENFIESYHTKSVTKAIEDKTAVFTIKQGVGKAVYFKNRNTDVKGGKSYKLSYMVKGIGELTFDFYPDYLPQTLQVFDSNNWKQYAWKFTMPDNIPSVVLFRAFLDTKPKMENELQFKNFKLEEVR
jgi:hypothetical protein